MKLNSAEKSNLFNKKQMAIIKQATNIRVQIKKEYTSFAGKMEETAKKIFVYSTKEDLSLNSNKKIIGNGNQ